MYESINGNCEVIKQLRRAQHHRKYFLRVLFTTLFFLSFIVILNTNLFRGHVNSSKNLQPNSKVSSKKDQHPYK